ncbi:MAG: hypothetical protein D6E12_16110 [Desulfovibrio sp.]|nr:MAG: hypothetical protein D6E12_16110 [Desulfovibrio sp.]
MVWRAGPRVFPALLLGMALALVVGGAGPGPPAPLEHGPGASDWTECRACHPAMTWSASQHDLACDACHVPFAQESSTTHLAVVTNPSALNHAKAICGPCHQLETESVLISEHATCPDMIGHTRYLWGAQHTPEDVPEGLGLMPRPLERPRSPAMLVDDFLRRQCLRCHVGVRDASSGAVRPEGCAACHPVHGSPQTGASREEACLRCHTGNHVGADYYGWFERDTAPMYQQAVVRGETVLSVQGVAVHALAPDIHAQYGLGCLDCHSGDQVMGLDPTLTPSCEGCHGGYGNRPGDRVQLWARNGRVLEVSPIPANTPSHDQERHGRLRCSSCHGQWFFGDYGLSAMRSDAPDAARKLESSLSFHSSLLPGSLDYLSLESNTGVWVTAWRFRRWENPPLGVDRHGRIAVLRPQHQYLVSYVNRLGQVVLNSVVPERGDGSGPGWAFSPYTPHSTAPVGRSCPECHGNPTAVGQGLVWEEPGDLALLAASPPVAGDGRLLNGEEEERLLNPGIEYARDCSVALRQRLGVEP